MPPGGNKFED